VVHDAPVNASRMKKPHRPVLTHAARPATFEVEAYNERGEMVPTSIAGEHPLTLYLDKRELVTLMTLGHAPEALAIGYLRNQRLVRSLEDIAAVQVDWETNSCAITTTAGKPADIRRRTRKRTVTTGCGQGTVFGDLMEEIERVRLREDVRLADAQLFDLIEGGGRGDCPHVAGHVLTHRRSGKPVVQGHLQVAPAQNPHQSGIAVDHRQGTVAGAQQQLPHLAQAGLRPHRPRRCGHDVAGNDHRGATKLLPA